jgi:hypothetical protein
MLAAAAMNFKRMMNIWKANPLLFLWRFWRTIFRLRKMEYAMLFIPLYPKVVFKG